VDYLIATHNKGKKAELERILKPLGINIKLPEDIGIELTDVEETGTTFRENAYLKAFNGMKESNLPCIADDSGLIVDALPDKLGIHTARYGGEDMPYPEKIQKLIGEMKDVENRAARFISTICCVYPDETTLYAEGMCEGVIGFEPMGNNGFGFDPIFYVGDKSFAALTAEEKDAISHRGNALRNFRKIFENS